MDSHCKDPVLVIFEIIIYKDNFLVHVSVGWKQKSSGCEQCRNCDYSE